MTIFTNKNDYNFELKFNFDNLDVNWQVLKTSEIDKWNMEAQKIDKIQKNMSKFSGDFFIIFEKNIIYLIFEVQGRPFEADFSKPLSENQFYGNIENQLIFCLELIDSFLF